MHEINKPQPQRQVNEACKDFILVLEVYLLEKTTSKGSKFIKRRVDLTTATLYDGEGHLLGNPLVDGNIKATYGDEWGFGRALPGKEGQHTYADFKIATERGQKPLPALLCRPTTLYCEVKARDFSVRVKADKENPERRYNVAWVDVDSIVELKEVEKKTE